MTRLTIDRNTIVRLRGLDPPVELCDEAGVVVGVFMPSVPHSAYRGVDSPASEEELLRSEQESARPLPEILRDLEGRP